MQYQVKDLVFILYATENTLGCSTPIPRFEIKLKGTLCKYSAVLGEDGNDGVISIFPNQSSYRPYMYLK